jgi:hypothetical protein
MHGKPGHWQTAKVNSSIVDHSDYAGLNNGEVRGKALNKTRAA